MSDLLSRIADLSPERRDLLLQRLSQQRATAARPQITRQPRESHVFPLSFAQQRLWFLDRVDPGTPVYNIPVALRLSGVLDIAVMERSINEIVRRHEALRTTFAAVDGRPTQLIARSLLVPLPVVDLQHYPAAARAIEVERRVNEEAQRPFDLARGPLLRVVVLRLDERAHVLLLTMHHIVADGWSVAIFTRELEALYSAFVAGQPAPLADLPIQYVDYAIWQAGWLQGAQLETQRAYWRQRLAGISPVLDLPTDRPRAPVRTFRGARRTQALSAALSDQLKTLARQEEITLFMALLAGFKILMSRYSGQDDIVVGTPTAGRPQAETQALIGFFLNTLVLRTDLSGAPTVREVLRRVRETCLGAYAHQELPFEKLLEDVQPDRDLSHTPLFQVFFNMLNMPSARMELPGLSLEAIAPPDIGAKFDLTLYVEEKGAQIHLELVYNADLFAPARMHELLEQYQLLLAQMANHPQEQIDRLTLVTSAAVALLPDPRAPLELSWEGTVHERVTQLAQRHPERLAVLDPHERWTYAELATRSSQLAHDLIAQGIRPQDVVAIYAHRSAALVWALLGVLKAGAAFTILDPAYPAARLIDYLRLAQPRGWVQLAAAGTLPAALEQLVAELPCRVVLSAQTLDAAEDALARYPTTDPALAVEPDDLAYVTFTSGSTGRPKGIMGTHRPISHFLEWHRRTFAFDEADRFSMLSGLSHDPLLRDVFTPLWIGATLCIPDPEALRSPGYLAEWMRQAAISVAHLTPALGLLLSEATVGGAGVALPALHHVFFGGDVLTQRDVARLRRATPAARCVNFYGATETPQGIAYFVVPDGGAEAYDDAPSGERAQAIIPLGRGIADAQLLVLNAAQQLAGIGELGEIYVRTPYLTRGYIGDDGLSGERFIANPFAGDTETGDETSTQSSVLSPQSSPRLYRTADLGRYLPDGTVAFHGRADLQVKIRGFRIEPGEIEAALGCHAAVREAVVIVREDVPGDKRLVAYLVPTNDQRPLTNDQRPATADQRPTTNAAAHDTNSSSFVVRPSSLTDELRSFLRDRLPSYMVPSAFVLLDTLPLTPNGKVDRKALPQPDAQQVKAAYVMPRTELERTISDVWQDVLHVQMIGVDDNFFDLGGSSIHIVQVQSKLRDALHREIPIVEMFKYPTVGSLARSLDQEQPAQPTFQEIDDRVKKQNAALHRQRQLRSRP